MGQTEGQWIPGPGGSIHSLRIHPFQSTGITLTLILTNWFMKGVCLSQPVSPPASLLPIAQRVVIVLLPG